MSQPQEDPRAALRRIIAAVVQEKYDALTPAQRTDFARADLANDIIIALEKAGCTFSAPRYFG